LLLQAPRENSKNILKNKKLLGLNPQLRDEFRGIVTVDFKNASPSALLFTLWEFSCSGCAISHKKALAPGLQRYFVAVQRLPVQVIDTGLAAAVTTLPLFRLPRRLWLRIVRDRGRVSHRRAAGSQVAARWDNAA